MPDITTIVIPEAVAVGTILPTGADIDSLPDGYLLCDGTSFDTTVQLALFTVIGYKFGGSASNFNVPDFRESFPRGPPNLDNGGGTGGVDEVTLSEAEMPQHTHIQNSHTHIQDSHTHTQNSHAHTQVGHSHSYNARGNGGAFATGSPSAANASFGSTTGGATPVINGSTATNQTTTPTNQTTTPTNQNAGSDNSHENKPPFVDCPFMIKN